MVPTSSDFIQNLYHYIWNATAPH